MVRWGPRRLERLGMIRNPCHLRSSARMNKAKELCLQSPELTAPCDVCKQPSTLMHLPVRSLGFYCEKHCPVCSTRCDSNGEIAHGERGALLDEIVDPRHIHRMGQVHVAGLD